MLTYSEKIIISQIDRLNCNYKDILSEESGFEEFYTRSENDGFFVFVYKPESSSKEQQKRIQIFLNAGYKPHAMEVNGEYKIVYFIDHRDSMFYQIHSKYDFDVLTNKEAAKSIMFWKGEDEEVVENLFNQGTLKSLIDLYGKKAPKFKLVECKSFSRLNEKIKAANAGITIPAEAA